MGCWTKIESSLLLIILVNDYCVFGSFLENVVDYTSVHLRGGYPHSQNYHKSQVLDPLRFQRSLSISASQTRLDLLFDGFVRGYSSYSIQKLHLTPDLKLSLDGVLIDTEISGSYKMNGSWNTIIPMNGDGIYLFQLKNVSVALEVQILPKSGHIQVVSFDLDYSFDNFRISLWGLTGDQDVGNVLEEFLKDFISIGLKTQRATLRTLIKSYILNQGNEKLKTFTLGDIIELIKSIFVY